MDITTTNTALLRLMQLSSVSLPVGSYAFSQGIEFAIDKGWLTDDRAIADYLDLQLSHAIARLDLAMVPRIYRALSDKNTIELIHWNQYLLASRETHELYVTDHAMGSALRKLQSSLGVEVLLPKEELPSFVTLFTETAFQWEISPTLCMLGLAWSWLESQLAAITKLLPLGQTQAQLLLSELQGSIPLAIQVAWSIGDDELGGTLPALAIASALHETQYTRLFRS